MLLYPVSHLKHTSCRKIYSNEFVANVSGDNMGIIILTSEDVEAVRGQKYHVSAHFGTLTQCSIHPRVPVLLTKDSIRIKK